MPLKLSLVGAVALTLLTTTLAHAEPPTQRPTRAKNPAFIAGGTGLILFGLAAGAGAGFFTAFALNCNECFNPPQGGIAAIAGGFGLLSLGGIGGGIAMITIGARRVDVGVTIGGECATTSECSSTQHCIEGRCRGLEPVPVEAVEQSHPKTASGAIMLGDGRGYVPTAIITDACAFLTTIPPWMIAYAADASRFGVGFQAAAFIQLAGGPALHLFKGRIGPALISLLGWTTVGMTTFFVPTIVSPNGDRPNGLAAGTAMLIGGGITMTVIDAFMARPARPSDMTPQPTTWAPSFRFVTGGAIAGFLGSF